MGFLCRGLARTVPIGEMRLEREISSLAPIAISAGGSKVDLLSSESVRHSSSGGDSSIVTSGVSEKVGGVRETSSSNFEDSL